MEGTLLARAKAAASTRRAERQKAILAWVTERILDYWPRVSFEAAEIRGLAYRPTLIEMSDALDLLRPEGIHWRLEGTYYVLSEIKDLL